MSSANDHTILGPNDGTAAEVINPQGAAPLCLVCEHASAFIPPALADLGLAPQHRNSHAVWDIGARDLAIALSDQLDAPLVASRVSRLVYDCNRPPDAPDAIPERTEVIDVPGNVGLGHAQRAARVQQVYHPFRDMLARTLDAFRSTPALVTIHSFTPIWHGQPRAVELGLLHDRDERLAHTMYDARAAGLNVMLNAPYSATDGVTHTLQEHALPRGLQNVMLEIRNDLISDSAGVARFADLLASMLTTALSPQVAT